MRCQHVEHLQPSTAGAQPRLHISPTIAYACTEQIYLEIDDEQQEE